MENNEELGTKEKILMAAKQLFGEKGFNGTSTREIAGLAEVNLAGLHYHFQNKEFLYEEVVREIFEDAKKQVNAVAVEKDWRTEDFAVRIFEMFLETEPVVMEKFRIVLLGSVKLLQNPPGVVRESEGWGPIGPYLDECMKREFGDEIDAQGRLWAIKVISSFIEMNSMRHHLTVGTPFIWEKSDMVNDLRRLVRSVLKEIRG